MDINVNTPTAAEHIHPDKSETLKAVPDADSKQKELDDENDSNSQILSATSTPCQSDSSEAAEAAAFEKLQGSRQTKNDTVTMSSFTATNEMEQPFSNEKNTTTTMMTSSSGVEMGISSSADSSTAAAGGAEEGDDDEEDDDDDEGEAAEYDVTTGSTTTSGHSGEMTAAAMLQNMTHHSFDDIQFFPASHHRSLRLQPQFQFHHEQLNDPNFHLGSNLSCFDASGLVNLSGSGSVSSSFSLISDSTSGDINSAFSDSPFVFPDNVMEYGEPQFFPGNCVGYLETILEEDDEEYEEEEGCSGRHWWTADSDTDTDSVIRVDNHGHNQQQKPTAGCLAPTAVAFAQVSSGNNSIGNIPGEKDEVRPHFRSSASSRPFELEDLHLFDQLDHAFEETLREPKRRSSLPFGHQLQSVGQTVEFGKTFEGKHQTTASLNSIGNGGVSAGLVFSEGIRCQKTTTTTAASVTGASNNDESKTGADHHVFIESTNNESKDEMTTKGLKMLTQENVKAHAEENSAKIIYEVDEEKEQSSKKLGNAESRETFGSSLSPSSSDSEAPAEVAEEDFFYSSPGSEEEECRSQESEESCSSSDDSEKKGVVLAEFSLGPHAGNGGGFNPSSAGIFGGGTRSRRSFDSPSRLKSFRSFDSLNCLAGTELLFSKPDTFPSIHHIKEVSEPSSESESSNEVSVAEERGLVIPEEDEEEEVEQNNKIEGSQSLPSQHLNTVVTAAGVGFPGPGLNQISNKNSTASSSTSTVSSSTSGSGLRSTENLSEDSGIGNDGISSTAASTPGAFIEESNVIMSNNMKPSEDCSGNNKATSSPSVPTYISSINSPASEISEATNAQEVDALLDSAKEYITRAEFALNPFVYSSLSSSEADSSISGAPSLSSNKMSISSRDESLQTQQQLHAIANRMKDKPNNFYNPSKDAPHEFVLDCHSTTTTTIIPDKAKVQNRSVSCQDKTDTENGTNETLLSTRVTGSSPLNSTPNSAHDTTPLESTVANGCHLYPELKRTPPPPNSSPIPTINISPSGTSSPPASKSNDNTVHQMTFNGSQDKRELVHNKNDPHEGQSIILNGSSSVVTHTSQTATALSLPPATTQRTTDISEACAADKLAHTARSKLSAQLPATANHTGNGIKNSTESSAATTTGTVVVSNIMEAKPTDLDTNAGIPFIHDQDHHQKYGNMTRAVIDRNAENENVFRRNNNNGGDIMLSSSSSTPTTDRFYITPPPIQPRQQTPATVINEHERNAKEVSSIPSARPPPSKTLTNSPWGEERDYGENDKGDDAKETSCFKTPYFSCTSDSNGLSEEELNISSVDDAEGERARQKYAPLPLPSSSSSPLLNAADKSFLACPSVEQDHPEHQSQKDSSSSSFSSASSSSGDEQNENISCQEQPRFRRQRSDSESEYEAAESAVERNNVDMAYDIIVNSPSKKQGLARVASPVSSVSGVVGAMNVPMSSPSTETESTTSSLSSYSAKSSSLAHVQPVVEETRSSSGSLNATSPLTPAQYHSQSQNETNANKCDNKKSGPVSTLNSSLINIHPSDMHNISNSSGSNSSPPTANATCKKEENINKHNTSTTATTIQNDDKKLPLFESCLDDYDDDDIADDNVTSISTTAALPPVRPIITENMHGSIHTPNHTTNNIFIAVSSYTHKTVCTTRHGEDGQMKHVTDAAGPVVAVNGIQHLTGTTKEQASKAPSSLSSSSSFPLEKQQQPHRHEIENTSLLLHHHHQAAQHNQHQRLQNNQGEQYENSDELATTTRSSQVALPQSHSHVSAAARSSNGILGGGFVGAQSEYKGLIVTDGGGGDGTPVNGRSTYSKNFSGHAGAQQQKQDHRKNNELGSVTLDDSTSADVAHNNLQLNHQQHEPCVFSASYPGGASLASSGDGVPKVKENYSQPPATAASLNQHITSESPYQAPSSHHSHCGNSNNISPRSSLVEHTSGGPTINKPPQQRQRSVECSKNSSADYHHHQQQEPHPTGDGDNKVVITEPYCPNQIGVVEVKKFLAGYVAAKECDPYSQPASTSCATGEGSSAIENNNKQRKTEPTEYYQSQSVKNQESSVVIGGPTNTATSPTASSTSHVSNSTGGGERVILGNSNFGFFGRSSSHARSSGGTNLNTSTTPRTPAPALESHESAFATVGHSSSNTTTTTAAGLNVLPQVNLDLHSSGFSSGYGFPCPSTFPIAGEHYAYSQAEQNTWLVKDEQQQQQHQLRLPLKENNTFCPSPIDTSNSSTSSANKSGSSSGSGSSTSIKRSVSPSSSFPPLSSSNNTKAVHELPKGLGKPEAAPPPPPLRRDQPQQQQGSNTKDSRLQQQEHLHLEDISLYSGVDKFSVPLGAIKAAVVAISPSIPSYIVGSSSHIDNAPSPLTSAAEKNASKIQNSNGSLVEGAGISRTCTNTAGVTPQQQQHYQQHCASEANGNLSKVFPKGTITSYTKSNSVLNGSRIVCGSSNALAAVGGEKITENNDTNHGAPVPDILKQFPCTSSNTAACSGSEKTRENVDERNNASRGVALVPASVKGVMEFDITTSTSTSCRNQQSGGSSSGMSGNGRNITKKQQDSSSGTGNNNPIICTSNIDSLSSVEMLRSDSPAGSSAPLTGIPLKTKTYGPRNEVEVVVVRSRTPSPAPGGFVSTSSSFPSAASSQKLPSPSWASTTGGQHSNEPVFSRSGRSSSSSPHYDDGVTADYSSSGGGGGAFRESSIPPPPSSPSPTPASNAKATRSRVHFSPVVSEISWRESYIDQSSECSGSTEDLLAKLEVTDLDGNFVVKSQRSEKGEINGGSNNNHSASANLRKAGAAAAAGVAGGGELVSGHLGDTQDNCGGAGGKSDVGSSATRPLQVYDIQMSTRADSPTSLIPTARGQIPSGKCPILVEKVEMRSSPLHDHEEDHNSHVAERPLVLSNENQSSRKLMPVEVHDNDDDDLDHEANDFDNDPERVTDLVDFRHNSNRSSHPSSNGNGDQNNGTLGLYEDVEVQIEPVSKKTPGLTTLSMVPDLLSQCENTNNTLTHIDVKIEETVPGINTKNIVLNIGQNTTNKDVQPQRTGRKSQSPQPQEVLSSASTSEPRQIFPKMFAEENKNDNKRNSLPNTSSSAPSKGKKSSKGFTIQGLGSSGKKSDKEDKVKEMGGHNGNNGSNNSNIINTGVGVTGQNVEQAGGGDVVKENKKSNKPGFFERLSKIRLSSGSKNKKQKVHPKTDEIHQEGGSSGTPTATNIIGGASSRPLRSANSVNVNGSGNASSKHGNNTGANNSSSSSQIANNHSSPGTSASSSAVQPILKKSTTASASTIPGGFGHHCTNDNDMGMIGDTENEPDDAAQAFENILEEIAGLKSIQLRQEKSSNSSIDKSPSSQQVRSFAKRKQFYNSTNNASAGSPSPPVSPPNSSRSYSDLDSKLSQFKEDTSRTLDTISKSHPDLEIIEDAVKQRQKSMSPEPSKHDIESARRPAVSTLPKASSASTKSPSYAATEAAQNSEREWYRLLKSATEKFSYHKGPKDEHSYNNRDNTNALLSHKTGIVETDLDTGASREMLDEDMLQLDCKVPCYTVSTSEIPTSTAAASTSVMVTSAGSPGTAAKTRSLTNLSTRLPLSIAPTSQFEESAGDLSDSEERAKSLEFLLDENHKSSSVPPENKLRLETRQLSEHELRIQRSLQRLNVPEWYKQHEIISTAANVLPPVETTSTQSKSGTLSILKRSEYGSSGGLAGGWTGLSTYKAPSMSSLQSNGGRSSGTLNKNFVRGRPATMSVTRTSKESLLASGSASHSPSAFERSSFTYGMPFTMTRFGQGRLSTHSSSVSPPSTPDSTTKTTSYVKKPYLGWRSQEKLNAGGAGASSAATNPGPPKLSIYLPPAERLAADLLATRAKSPHPPVRPPVSDRPPLPRAPPRSDKTALIKTHNAIDDSIETTGGRPSSPVISKQTSSLAVVTKLSQSQQSNSAPPDFSQGNFTEGTQSQSRSKNQSTKVAPDVHDSIRQVTTAINHYVSKGNDTQGQRKASKPKSGKKQAIWIESSFVGQKPPTN